MYYLQTKDKIAGKWKSILNSQTKNPLDTMLESMDKSQYRIIWGEFEINAANKENWYALMIAIVKKKSPSEALRDMRLTEGITVMAGY